MGQIDTLVCGVAAPPASRPFYINDVTHSPRLVQLTGSATWGCLSRGRFCPFGSADIHLNVLNKQHLLFSVEMGAD
jgi:hypothetical protein